MKNIESFKKSSSIFEIRQLLQTIHQEFFQTRQIINQINKKNQLFYWFENCQITFEQLKKRVIETFVLLYFLFELKTFLKLNSFDCVSIEMLSQKEDDDLIKSITYFSKTLSLVECNYEIYDRELLTIIKCFEQWRAEL
jgi:hypothetical protein